MRLARAQMDGVISGIGSLDADHFLTSVAGHVRHALGLVDPRIPDNSAVGAAFFDEDTAVSYRVVYNASGLGAQVYLIGPWRYVRVRCLEFCV